MGKHDDKAEQDEGRFEGELPKGELRKQLAERTNPLDGLAEVSQSPIETF